LNHRFVRFRPLCARCNAAADTLCVRYARRSAYPRLSEFDAADISLAKRGNTLNRSWARSARTTRCGSACFLNMPVMQQPEAYIGGATELFGEDGCPSVSPQRFRERI
jgi:hypothetical protein